MGWGLLLRKLKELLVKKPDKPKNPKNCTTCGNISPERANHILDGDKTGGGHRFGTGKPGKSEFPQSWNDRKILDNISDVARNGNSAGAGRTPGSTLMEGVRDGVNMRVVVGRDGNVISGWPVSGQGVKVNPR